MKEGKLIMPKAPTSLFVYSAQQKDYDPIKGEVRNGYLRSVIYIPYATSESTDCLRDHKRQECLGLSIPERMEHIL